MFQYAAGYALAKKLNTELKLDLTDFRQYKLHRYSLSYLSISGRPTTDIEVAPFRPTAKTFVQKIMGKLGMAILPVGLVKEKSLRFDPSLLQQTRPVLYLDGYWQTEKYFFDVTSDLRREFQPKNSPEGQNATMLARIQSTQAVSLHIRRGDYVTNSETNQVHGTADLSYYYQAIKEIHEAEPAMQLFVFSDDPVWVKENLKTHVPVTYVDFNGPEKNYEDLRLMSACRHHIIANSSFSWWGAWLGAAPGQKVFAPKQWFKTGDLDATDLVPKRWERR